jgi:2-deoxystreptamine N-acetyl-D-glucosaminyltransferase/2-deoxystreptamine glucosyltransferase
MAPVHLIVIGWGPLEAGLRRRADELRISNHVTFTGEVDGPSHIAALDILAHTATFEAFAYVFLEAFAAGIPIVTTRVGVAEDLVKDGITGYICDPWDPEHFALLLQRVVENPELRASMAASARTRAAAFTADAMVNATADLYHRVCKRPRAVPSLPVAASENNS